MLKDRILATLKFFGLQGTPMTLLDLQKYLLNDPEVIKKHLNSDWEVDRDFAGQGMRPAVGAGEILSCLEQECAEEVVSKTGFYALKSQPEIIDGWSANYIFLLKREKLIRRYLSGLKALPFVRGAAILGSQAFGLPKANSDIDLLVITHAKHLWLVRLLCAAYFQLLCKRRHGAKIANRFCLNHFVAEDKALTQDLNLYTASEYIKMRPAIGGEFLMKFQNENSAWINFFFPNQPLPEKFIKHKPAKIQAVLEKWLSGRAGEFLEAVAKKLQEKRINTGEFIIATDSELSFHPDNRKKQLFKSFFET